MGAIGKGIGNIIGSITGAKQAGEAASEAGQLQYQATQEAVAEQRRQFDELVKLMSPYVTAGGQALGQQQTFLGLQGPEAEQAAIERIATSPQFQALTQQGENALLQNAAATGGLRGGNFQASLAQFRPQVLSSLLEQQYNRLGGLTELGQASAAMQGKQGMQLGQNVSDLFGRGAAAQAMGIVAKGNVPRQAFGDLLNMGSMYFGAKALLK